MKKPKEIKFLLVQIVSSLTALAFAWLVLLAPALKEYYFQVFCALIFVFIVINIFSRHAKTASSQTTQLRQNWEICLVGSAIFLLIGATGGLNSTLLPLFFIYFFFAIFVTPFWLTLIMTLAEVTFFLFFTSAFGQNNYGDLLAIGIFVPIAFFAEKYYQRAVKESLNFQAEKEKVAYYNMYAEKKQNELLASQKGSKKEITDLTSYLQSVIPQIDALQKQSRFSENQLIVSGELTKIALSLRRALRQVEAISDHPSSANIEPTEKPQSSVSKPSLETKVETLESNSAPIDPTPKTNQHLHDQEEKLRLILKRQQARILSILDEVLPQSSSTKPNTRPVPPPLSPDTSSDLAPEPQAVSPSANLPTPAAAATTTKAASPKPVTPESDVIVL